MRAMNGEYQLDTDIVSVCRQLTALIVPVYFPHGFDLVSAYTLLKDVSKYLYVIVICTFMCALMDESRDDIDVPS